MHASHGFKPDWFTFIVSTQHLLGDGAILGQVDLTGVIHRCGKEVLSTSKHINDLASILR
jgi:hypothetical protein